METQQKLDAHAKPPEALKAFYKTLQKRDDSDFHHERLRGKNMYFEEVVEEFGFVLEGTLRPRNSGFSSEHHALYSDDLLQDFSHEARDTVIKIYTHPDIPGLQIIPTLFPPSIQKSLISRLLHRDLSDESHQNNLNLHYNLSYPKVTSSNSFFAVPPALLHTSKNPSLHNPISTTSLLSKKLRWFTLGGQYDWTRKVYPADSAPPPFPPDIAGLLHGLFPSMRPEAAIVNFYSPGDTLSLHRDVAEESPRGLVSVSLGCDGVFVLGLEEHENCEAGGEGNQDGEGGGEEKRKGRCKMLALRLRSGDAVFMDGEARYAWHGVPKILRGTCPEYLRNWPVGDGAGDEETEKAYEIWMGYLERKRVNLNVRQMAE